MPIVLVLFLVVVLVVLLARRGHALSERDVLLLIVGALVLVAAFYAGLIPGRR